MGADEAAPIRTKRTIPRSKTLRPITTKQLENERFKLQGSSIIGKTLMGVCETVKDALSHSESELL